MKDLLKNAFPLYGKVASTLKNLKNSKNIEKSWCSLGGIYSSLKTDFSQVSIIVSTSRKNCRNEGLAEKYVPVEEWTVSTGSLTVIWENERKWIPLARKSVALVKKMLFLLQLASTSFKDGFH